MERIFLTVYFENEPIKKNYLQLKLIIKLVSLKLILFTVRHAELVSASSNYDSITIPIIIETK